MKSFEEILQSMKQSLAVSNLDTQEGSYTDTLIRAVAMEIAADYFDHDAMIPVAFVDETSGIYIDRRCAEYGIERKPGTKATATVTFAGSNGTTVPAGTAVQTAEGLVFATDKAVTVSDGTATAAVTAQDVGEQYNVEENAITTLQNSAGVTIQSSTAAQGGTDMETDAALVQRLYDLWRKPATSGNAYHYEKWALEVEGIGKAKVFPCWNGGGTVKVVVLGSSLEPPSPEQVAAVAAHIEEERPICVEVTVEAAETLTVDVAATVVLDGTRSAQGVQEQFSQLLDEYLRSIAFVSSAVIYNRIAYMLLSIDGVQDFTTLTVNGGEVNLTLADNQAPVLGEVTVT